MGNSVTGIEIKVTDVFRAGEIARHVEQALGFSPMAPGTGCR